jgi:hypothetical protein
MSTMNIRVDYTEKPEHEWEQPYEIHEVVFANEFIIVTTYECCFAMWTSGDATGELISGSLWKKGREFVAREEVERFYSECGSLPFVGDFDRTFWEQLDKRAAEGA